MDNNELRDVEDDIGRLTALELLNLNNNQVRLDCPAPATVLLTRPCRSDTSPLPGILPLDVSENLKRRGECRDYFPSRVRQLALAASAQGRGQRHRGVPAVV
jgi:hypothetical protein